MSALVSPVAEDFPILQAPDGGRRLVYLDSAATTQKPDAVIRRIVRYYEQENSNIHRGSYPLSLRAEKNFEGARRTVQSWIGASSPREIVFTKSSTESLNLLASAALTAWARPGDNVVVTELEHSSNYYPFREQCRARQLKFRVARAERDGTLSPEAVETLIDERTRLVSITAMSNVTGFRPDLPRIIRFAHRRGTRVAVDASQEIAHHRVDVGELDCDFLCFSGHKLYAPMGYGALYGKAEALEQLPPFFWGGSMVEKSGGGVECKTFPDRFEAGTPNVEAVLGLEAALEYLAKKDFDALMEYETELSHYLYQQLKTVPGLRLYAPAGPSPVVTFTLDGYGAYDVGVLLGGTGIAVRCGAHCAYPLMERMALENSCRVSLGIYNSAADVDALTQRLTRLGR